MSVIFINTGQCGNQLGFSIIDSIHKQIQKSNDNTKSALENVFFKRSRKSGSLKARAVYLDTEPKVVNDCIENAKSNCGWTVDTRSVAYMHGGAGNNWANGYDMCSGEYLISLLDCIRYEIEQCTHSPTLLLPHSLAGGTGSGLGTRLTEYLRDEFEDLVRINLAITPYHMGEVVVQSYNALLSLSKLSTSSDGIIIYENEIAHMMCQKIRQIDRPTLYDINNMISTQMVPILFPKYSYHNPTYEYDNLYTMADLNNSNQNHSNCNAQIAPSKDDNISNKQSNRFSFLNLSGSDNNDNNHFQKSDIGDDIRYLCQHPGYKFLDIKTTPQTTVSATEFNVNSWTSLLKSMNRMQLQGVCIDRYHSSNSSSNTIPMKTVSSSSSSSSSNAYTATTSSSSSTNRNSMTNMTHNTDKLNETQSGTKILASVLTFHGQDAESACTQCIHNSTSTHMNNTTTTSTPQQLNQSTTHLSSKSTLTSTPNSARKNVYSSMLLASKHSSSSSMQSPSILSRSNAELVYNCGINRIISPPVHFGYTGYTMNNYDISLSTLSNSNAMVPLLSRIHTKARSLYEQQAYVHQYHMYGVQQNDFIEAFHNVGQVISNYNNL